MPIKTEHIVIKPIFNQAEPMIWENFADIEMSARAEYGHMFLGGADANLWHTHHEDWEQLEGNISFGAFQGEEMVGFIKGFLVDKGEYKLDSLFVKPEFKHQGVGKRLLFAFEDAVSLVGSYIQGIAYDGARGFYKKYKYTVIGGKNDNPRFDKKLPKPNQGIIPVFGKWKSSDFRAKLNKLPVDSKILRKSQHQPLYVYVNEQQEIDVVGLRTKEGEDLVWVNPNIPQEYKNCREESMRSRLKHCR